MSRDELVADLMRRLRYRQLDAFVGRRVEVRSLETAHDDVAAALSDILSCRLAPNEVDLIAMGRDLGKFSTLELAFAIQGMGADVHVPRADTATLTALHFRFNWTDEELASTMAAEEDRTH